MSLKELLKALRKDGKALMVTRKERTEDPEYYTRYEVNDEGLIHDKDSLGLYITEEEICVEFTPMKKDQ